MNARTLAVRYHAASEHDADTGDTPGPAGVATVIGRTIGPYQVVARVGEGGMGQVYRARDTRLDRDVAIKTLHDKRSEGSQLSRKTVAGFVRAAFLAGIAPATRATEASTIKAPAHVAASCGWTP